MAKWMRKTSALKCKVHQAIVDEAIAQLELQQVFSKQQVLEKTGYEMISDSIRWDYIREFVEDRTKLELVPVSAKFFAYREHKKAIAESAMQRLIASGYGKKTAGYASTRCLNGALAKKRLEQKKAVTEGNIESYKAFTGKLIHDAIATQEECRLRLSG